ncbi:MAG TPA: sigma-70 family RNA polymerase sigma factor [Planctomycetota bacterium]|nr:sigma-70 family RNA polymerase sigma factor [Planctomycetota bacterium]
MAARGTELGGDKALVQRMLAGDDRAFDEFFAAYFESLYRFALVRVRDDANAAEEIAQATLCNAVRRMETYRGEAPLFTWLCTFCRHEISAWYGRNKVRQHSIGLAEDIEEVQAALDSLAADESDTPELAARRKELARLIRVALDRLPSHYGNVLEWKYIDELPVNEIAARLKVNPKAAESLLTRAREAFRDAFTALCGGQSQMETEA